MRPHSLFSLDLIGPRTRGSSSVSPCLSVTLIVGLLACLVVFESPPSFSFPWHRRIIFSYPSSNGICCWWFFTFPWWRYCWKSICFFGSVHFTASLLYRKCRTSLYSMFYCSCVDSFIGSFVRSLCLSTHSQSATAAAGNGT